MDPFPSSSLVDFETALYVVYLVSMAAGALLFVTWSRDPRGVSAWEYLVAAIIPVWSGLAYLAMATGNGVYVRTFDAVVQHVSY